MIDMKTTQVQQGSGTKERAGDSGRDRVGLKRRACLEPKRQLNISEKKRIKK